MTKFLMQLNACPASVSCQDGCVLAGAKMVVSQSYARIFFRNCVSTYVSVHHDTMSCRCIKTMALFAQHFTVGMAWKQHSAIYCRGEVYPVETDERLCEILETGVHMSCTE